MTMTTKKNERFQRLIGITDERGLKRMKSTRVAIGGLGLGGAVFINLVRMGIEDFHIADPDIYERTNIGRQRMAKESTLKKRKDECLLAEACDINPDVRVKVFKDGVNPENLDRFLDGVNWAVDVVDVFAMREKLALNQAARRKGIPLVSGGSLGFMGCAVSFEGDCPSFEELSGIRPESSNAENFRRFLQFLAPEIPQYMITQLERSLDGSTHVPFAVPGVEIAAAMIASHISNAVLGLGERVIAPYGTCFDAITMQSEIFVASHKERRFPGRKRLKVA